MTKKAKTQQFIQLKDTSGMLKNLSELLQEIRDKNVENLYIGYTRKNESMRTFWFGDQKSMAEFDRLRKEYPVRREFPTTDVVFEESSSVKEKLRGLGFKVSNPNQP